MLIFFIKLQHEDAIFKSTIVFTKKPTGTLMATPIIPKKLQSIINDISNEEIDSKGKKCYILSKKYQIVFFEIFE